VLFGWAGSVFGLPSIFWANALLLASGGALTSANPDNKTTA
jgi:hypothetical protein